MKKLRMKYSALNVDFDGPISLDLSRFEETCARGHQRAVKVVILPLLTSLSWKRLQIGMGMLPITTSTNDELFSRIKIDDFEKPWAFKI